MVTRLKLAANVAGLAYRLVATSIMTGMLVIGFRDYIKERSKR